MKKILPTAFLTFAVFYLSAQSEISKTFDLKNQKELLTRLFDADSICPNGEALWEPLTYSDELSANLSDDDWMHTRLDTLLYYNTYNIEKAVAIFETIHYEQGAISDCPTCGTQLSLAIYEKQVDGKWIIERFAKHFSSLGSYGGGGDIGLAQFGENQWCLSLQMDWMGQGVYSEYLSFLNLEDLEKVFNLVIHEDNQQGLATEAERTYSFDKSIHLLPTVETVNGWWEFDLVTQGTQPDNDVERAVPANTVERFAFNLETGTYMKTCQ